MRGARFGCSLALLALSAVFAPACDTTQPLQLEQQTFSLQMRGVGAVVPVYDVFDMFEDSARCQGDTAIRCASDADCVGTAPCVPADGVADDTDGDGAGDVYLWCKTRTSTPTTANVISVPFGFTIEVTILRAGTTEREPITSSAAMQDITQNVSDYDTTTLNIPGSPPDQPPITSGSSTYVFNNGRRLTAGTFEVASATYNPLSAAFPATYGLGNGLCSLAFYGPAVFDRSGANQHPLQFVLNKGDTVTVKAIRASTGFPNGVPIADPAGISMISTMSTAGRPVEVTGTIATDPANGPNASLAFTFTSF